MTNKIKFHLLASLLNIVSILLLMNIHEYIIKKYIDPHAFFARMGDYFYYIYILSLFIISWIAPLAIYKFKKYNRHFSIFLLTFVFVITILIIYNVLLHISTYEKYYNGLLNYIIERVIYISIKEETLIASFLISALIHINQLIIGKKLLPMMYKK